RLRDGLIGATVAAAGMLLLAAVRPVAGQAPAAPRQTPAGGAQSQATAGRAPAARRPVAPPVSGRHKAPRTAGGEPGLYGIWQAFVTADINVQDHDAEAGPHSEIMGAYGAWPGGQGIVEGGEIPYRPEALAQKKANAEKRTVVNITADDHRHDTGDPELKC